MHKNNILILTSDVMPGGISQMIAIHTMAFINLNFKVKLIIPKSSDAKRSVKNILKKSSYKKDHLKIVEYSKLQFYLSKLIKSNFYKKHMQKIDYCFVHNARLIKYVKKYTDKPLIAINHTGKLNQIKYYKYADLVLSVNKTISKQLIKSGVDKDKSIVCPNAIDKLPILNTLKNNNKNDELVIGAMGRLVEKKGFDIFIESIKILQNRNVKFKALIAGDGELLEYLKSISKDVPQIEFLGWVKNKSDFYSIIDIFCQPSNFEPFGLTLIEAMSYGLPVISTATEGPIEIINSSGKNGFIIPLKDHFQMAEIIYKLIEDKNKRIKIGKNARIHIEKNYTIQNLQNSLLKCINRLS